MNRIQYKSLTLIALIFAVSAIDGTKKAIQGFNFTAVTATDCPGIQIVPQNPTGAVGKTQFITSCYQALRSFNKFTGTPDGVLNIDAAAFTGIAAIPSTAGGTANGVDDAWLLYDPFIERYFFSYESNWNAASFPTQLEFIVSDSGIVTPATQWTTYTIPASQINPLGFTSPDGFIDYNQPAVDQNAYYIGISTNGASGFIGASLAVISKKSILAGSPNVTVFPGLFPEIIANFEEGSAAPAFNFDKDPLYGYFVSPIFEAPAGVSGNTIQMYRILDAGSNTPILGPLVTMNVSPFAYAFNFFSAHKGNLFGAGGRLQTGEGEFGPYVVVRNHQMYMCQDIQVDSNGNSSTTGDRVGIRWYQFDLTGDPTGRGRGTETPGTTPFLIQSGTLYDPTVTASPLFYYIGALMVNKEADLCISFSVSGDNAFVNTGYAFRAASDPLGTLRTPVVVTDSQFPYNFAPNTSGEPGPTQQRFGDQSTVAIDPCNDRTFWLNQPWAALQNAWGIQATQLIPSRV